MIMLTPLSQATIPHGTALATGGEGEVRGSRAHPSRLRPHLGRRLGLAVDRDLLADTGDDRIGGGGGVDRPVGARHRRESLEWGGCPAYLHAGRLPDLVPWWGWHLVAGDLEGRHGTE